ncbi:triple helix repeat-containing collagen [Streptomyces sp. KO7888]|nr:triple helix repeat-containing collagen [Streptomyces sp. KO7888]
MAAADEGAAVRGEGDGAADVVVSGQPGGQDPARVRGERGAQFGGGAHAERGDVEPGGEGGVGLAHPVGLRGDPAEDGVVPLGLGGGPCPERDDGGARGDQDQQGEDGRQSAPQPHRAPPPVDRGGQEVALRRRQLPRRRLPAAGIVGEGLAGGGQPRARVQRRVLPAEGQPGAGGLGEGAVDAEPVAFGVDPAAQPGPRRDEGLVGEFDGAVVEGEQPGGDQPVQYGAGAVGVAEVEFRVPGGAPGVGGAVARGDQPQQDPAGQAGLGGR